MIEETRKSAGLDFEELEAQGVELLPDRVEMTRRRRIIRQNAFVFQANVVAVEENGQGSVFIGEINQANLAEVNQDARQNNF